MLSETHITYNATGHPTTTASLVSGTNYLTSSATYNANGTVATTTDANGRTHDVSLQRNRRLQQWICNQCGSSTKFDEFRNVGL